MVEVYKFKEYKAYLNAALMERDKSMRGSRKALAEAMGCQNAYVSHVLNGDNHLSLEQAEGASRFLHQTEEERHFFILLLQLDRAGTVSLKKYFRQQIDVILQQRNLVQNRLRSEGKLNLEQQARYYSHWVYPAIHMLLMIGDYQNREAIAQRLKIDSDLVQEAMRFLESSGLVRFSGAKAEVNFSLLHLPSTSPLIRQHHTTWRLHAADRLIAGAPDHLHYSGAVALSRKDADQVRGILLDALERIKEIAKDSREEDVFSLALDLYPV